jgi:hypothetical protein
MSHIDLERERTVVYFNDKNSFVQPIVKAELLHQQFALNCIGYALGGTNRALS